MFLDFEDYRPDISPIGRAISWREGVLLSVIAHLVGVILVLIAPDWLPFSRSVAKGSPALLERDEPQRMVFVAPRNDLLAPKPPERAAPSDADRIARAPERAPVPANPLPFSRGNTPEPVERAPEVLPDAEPKLEPDPGTLEPPGLPEPPGSSEALDSQLARRTTPEPPPAPRPGLGGAPLGGSLGDALRNLQRYVEREQFNNPQGGNDQFGPAIQFDTMGVEFGPWIRRFVAQVRGNWEPLIPQAAMSMSGRVVLTFNVHKSGSITDLTVVRPSVIEAFTTAAYGALVSSNPTAPLPPEYPAERAFFTVTFFYNERPD